MGRSQTHAPKIAHAVPGRLRIQLSKTLSPDERKVLIADLKLSPEISDAKVVGNSLVIEHTEADEHPWSLLEKYFPAISRVSDEIDVAMARLTETPEVNKLVPLSFLAFGLWKGLVDGALLAGESAFAIIYISFDLYWKFQQENVSRKIQQHLGKQQLQE